MRALPACLCLLAGLAAPAAAFERALLPSEGAMEPCPAYGAGFARVPGTATCVRISGRVAAGADVGHAVRPPLTPPNTGRLQIDARTESSLGPVRSFVRIGAGR